MAGRLLLIGESTDDLLDLKVSFEGIGVVVRLAPDGLAGLETGAEFQPDLVVTEILTSRLSGFELASRIGSGSAGFAAPIIFYTEFYRDERARREVLAKYGAVEYFVRPFQKEALKRSVAAHFQDFLSSPSAVPIDRSDPEPPGSAAEVTPVAPQLTPVSAAAESQSMNSPSEETVQPGTLDGLSAEQPFDSEIFETEPETVAQSETRAAEMRVPAAHREGEPVPSKVFTPREPTLMLPVEESSRVRRLLASVPFRIAAVVIVAVLALYFVRDRFQDNSPQESVSSGTADRVQSSPSTEPPVEPLAQPSPPSAAAPSTAPVPETVVEDAKAKPVDPGESLPGETGVPKDFVDNTGAADPQTAPREQSAALSIQDVTGSRRGPVLRKMKRIQLSQEVLSSLTGKGVVVRVVIDGAGKVTEVTPLNQEGSSAALLADALAFIQEWEFSPSRRQDAGESVKYYSLKVQNPRQ